MSSAVSVLAAFAVLNAASAQAPAATITTTSAATSAPAAKNDDAKAESWLCRPGRQDACVVDLTTTIVAADGKLTKEGWTANPKAAVDCFYVYPTVSRDVTPNSDMHPEPEELNVIKHQLARFGSQCRLYAPCDSGCSSSTVPSRNP
jgi:predicted transglutaminase-like cysteine proteinase